jgi:SAM-dependent methyltransferase
VSCDELDVVSFVDVLHHTSDARILLREAARVSRRYIVIKDHLREGPFAKATLQAMDWIADYGHDVVLPYNYLSEQEWHEHFRDTNLSLEHWTERLGLYPFPFSLVFGLRLHFIARLRISSLGNAPFGGRAECHTDRSTVCDAAGMTL